MDNCSPKYKYGDTTFFSSAAGVKETVNKKKPIGRKSRRVTMNEDATSKSSFYNNEIIILSLTSQSSLRSKTMQQPSIEVH